MPATTAFLGSAPPGAPTAPLPRSYTGIRRISRSVLNFVLLTPSGKITRTFPIKGWRGISQSAWMPNGRDIIVPAAAEGETDDQMQLREFSAVTGKMANITKDVYGYRGASLTGRWQTVADHKDRPPHALVAGR